MNRDTVYLSVISIAIVFTYVLSFFNVVLGGAVGILALLSIYLVEYFFEITMPSLKYLQKGKKY